jgi:CRP/FNR family cyclic AMP-dependent transcriptional regulator
MSSDPVIVKALGATDIFGSLSKRALDRVARTAKIVHQGAGREITSEGDAGVGFHLITEGTVSVVIGSDRVATLGPDSYFGEISLIDGGPRTATVTSETELTTISLTTWDFRPVMDSEPEVTKALLLLMCKRLRAAEER